MPDNIPKNLPEKISIENIFLRTMAELKIQSNPVYIAHISMATRVILIEFVDIGKRYYIICSTNGLEMSQQIADSAPLLHITLSTFTFHDLVMKKIYPIPAMLEEKIAIEGIPIRQLRPLKTLWQDFCQIYQQIQSNCIPPQTKRRSSTMPYTPHRILKTWLKMPSALTLFTAKICHWLRLKRLEIRMLNNLQESWLQLDQDVRQKLLYVPTTSTQQSSIAIHTNKNLADGPPPTSLPVSEQSSGVPVPSTNLASSASSLSSGVPVPSTNLASSAPSLSSGGIMPNVVLPAYIVSPNSKNSIVDHTINPNDNNNTSKKNPNEQPTSRDNNIANIAHASNQNITAQNHIVPLPEQSPFSNEETVVDNRTAQQTEVAPWQSQNDEASDHTDTPNFQQGEAVFIPTTEDDTHSHPLEGIEAVISAGGMQKANPNRPDIIDPIDIEIRDEPTFTSEDIFFSPPWEDSELVDIPQSLHTQADVLEVDFSDSNQLVTPAPTTKKPIVQLPIPKNRSSMSPDTSPSAKSDSTQPKPLVTQESAITIPKSTVQDTATEKKSAQITNIPEPSTAKLTTVQDTATEKKSAQIANIPEPSTAKPTAVQDTKTPKTATKPDTTDWEEDESDDNEFTDQSLATSTNSHIPIATSQIQQVAESTDSIKSLRHTKSGLDKQSYTDKTLDDQASLQEPIGVHRVQEQIAFSQRIPFKASLLSEALQASKQSEPPSIKQPEPPSIKQSEPPSIKQSEIIQPNKPPEPNLMAEETAYDESLRNIIHTERLERPTSTQQKPFQPSLLTDISPTFEKSPDVISASKSEHASFTQRLSTTLQQRLTCKRILQTPYFQKFSNLQILSKDQLGGESSILPSTQILTNQEIVRIIENAYTILSQRGVKIPYDAMGKNLVSLGCTYENNIVKIPEQVLWKVLADTPRYEREKYPYTLWIAGHSARIFDYERRMSQEGTLKEARYIIGLMNVLPYISIASTGMIPSDVPRLAADVVSTALLSKYCNKPFIQEVYSVESAQFIQEIFNVTSTPKDRKEMLYVLRPIAPLLYKKAQLQVIEFCAQKQWPMLLCSSPEIGQHVPLDLPSIISLILSDWLAQLTMLKSYEHQREIILQANLRINDRNVTIYHAPELVQIFLGLRQVANYLHCPFINGNTCNITAWNLQTAWDKMWSSGLNWLLSNAFTGYAGFIGEDFSPEQLVLDNWLAEVWSQLSTGIRVNSETLDRKRIQELARADQLHKADLPNDSFLNLLGIKGGIPTDLPGRLHQEVVDLFNQGKPQSLLSQDKSKELEHIVDARMQQLGD